MNCAISGMPVTKRPRENFVIGAHLADQPGKNHAVNQAVGWFATTTSGPLAGIFET